MNYYKQKIKSAGTNQGTLFKVVKNMLDCSNNTNLPVSLNPLQLANDFNVYFTDKVVQLRESIPLPSSSFEYTPFNGQRLNDFSEVNDDDIFNIIKEHGIKTSPVDPIPLPI